MKWKTYTPTAVFDAFLVTSNNEKLFIVGVIGFVSSMIPAIMKQFFGFLQLLIKVWYMIKLSSQWIFPMVLPQDCSEILSS